MTPRCAYVLRSLLVAEFAAALGTWAFADLPWWLACLVATTSLTVFLLTFPDPHGPGEASERLRVVPVLTQPAVCRCGVRHYRVHTNDCTVCEGQRSRTPWCRCDRPISAGRNWRCGAR